MLRRVCMYVSVCVAVQICCTEAYYRLLPATSADPRRRSEHSGALHSRPSRSAPPQAQNFILFSFRIFPRRCLAVAMPFLGFGPVGTKEAVSIPATNQTAAGGGLVQCKSAGNEYRVAGYSGYGKPNKFSASAIFTVRMSHDRNAKYRGCN